MTEVTPITMPRMVSAGAHLARPEGIQRHQQVFSNFRAGHLISRRYTQMHADSEAIDDTLDLHLLGAKIYQQADSKSSGFQVVQALCQMNVVERPYCLQLHNDAILDQEVGQYSPTTMSLIVHRQRPSAARRRVPRCAVRGPGHSRRPSPGSRVPACWPQCTSSRSLLRVISFNLCSSVSICGSNSFRSQRSDGVQFRRFRSRIDAEEQADDGT